MFIAHPPTLLPNDSDSVGRHLGAPSRFPPRPLVRFQGKPPRPASGGGIRRAAAHGVIRRRDFVFGDRPAVVGEVGPRNHGRDPAFERDVVAFESRSTLWLLNEFWHRIAGCNKALQFNMYLVRLIFMLLHYFYLTVFTIISFLITWKLTLSTCTSTCFAHSYNNHDYFDQSFVFTKYKVNISTKYAFSPRMVKQNWTLFKNTELSYSLPKYTITRRVSSWSIWL